MRRVLIRHRFLLPNMMESENETFHVVCRDCPFESLRSDPTVARRLADEHETTTDHTTQYARIQ
jgi:hypothetical protein